MVRADNYLLAMALVGYEVQKAKIDAAIKEIQAQLGDRGPGRPKVTADGAVAPAKRVLSAAARRKIAAAQRNNRRERFLVIIFVVNLRANNLSGRRSDDANLHEPRAATGRPESGFQSFQPPREIFGDHLRR